MVNFNGNILQEEAVSVSINNRGFNYGDALFETIKVSHGKVLFWEDHYFRLMSSMRILRMEIPMSFTLEFLENEILKVLEANGQLQSTVRVKLIVNRKEGGLYTPETNAIGYVITSKVLNSDFYERNGDDYKVDLYKDHYVASGLLSTLKSTNRLVNVIGGVYARENDLNNCLILNTDKTVVEALNGNVFLVKGNIIKTPPLSDGCIKGVMRKQIIDIVNLMPEFTLEEASISPFELQKADELFITNVITGIKSITQYRKKAFASTVSNNLLSKLNVKVRLS